MALVSFLLSSLSLMTFWLILPLLLPVIAFGLSLRSYARCFRQRWIHALMMLYAALVLGFEVWVLATGYQA